MRDELMLLGRLASRGLAWIVVMSAAAMTPADDSAWRAGAAKADITPTAPMYMMGYANRTRPFEGIVHSLWAKALVLEDADGGRACLITCDLCAVNPAIVEPACRRIESATGIVRSRILINASHTHCGPAIADSLEPSSLVTDEVALRSYEYTRLLSDVFVDIATQANQRLRPARLSVGLGVAKFVMNRREFTAGGVKLGANPRGLADRGAPVIRVDDGEGRPLAIVFGATCHNTTLGGDEMRINGDFAGFAQVALEWKFPNAQAMFIQGCAGDSNPFPRGTMELASLHGRTLADEVERVAGEALTPLAGPLVAEFEVIDAPLRPAPPRETLERLIGAKSSWEKTNGQAMLAIMARGETPPATARLPISVWRFGDTLSLVGLSGEVVVDYLPRIEQAVGPRDLWVAAYCHDVFGYDPSKRVSREGGYETRGLYSGGVGYFAPEAEDVIVDAVSRLSTKTGRDAEDHR